jgi:penicillin G amidase
LPTFFNPPAGFIATANNRVAPDNYPYQLSYQYFPGYRALRINSLLSGMLKATVADMRTIQGDTYALSAEALCPYVLAAVKPGNDLEVKSLDQLKTWDLRLETDRIGGSIYETWYLFMLQNTVNDELGADLGNWYQVDILTSQPTLVEWMADPNNIWFDDVTTSKRETRDDIIHRSFTDAVNWLSAHYGGDISQWEWGRLHTTTFVNAPLGQSGISPIEALVNVGPVASPGDMSTVNQSWYTWPNHPFNAFHGTSQRVIIDLSNWDNMLAVNSTGQSGNILSPNFKDQVSLWQKIEYHSVPFTRDAVEKNANAILILVPSEATK